MYYQTFSTTECLLYVCMYIAAMALEIMIRTYVHMCVHAVRIIVNCSTAHLVSLAMGRLCLY